MPSIDRGASQTLRRLKLRELDILSAAVDAGSMGKAADRLSISQPSVSEAIANIEALLGVPLLDRTARGIEPTIYARALLTRGRVVFDELAQAINDIESLADPAKGEVRIGCAESFSAGLTPAIIQRVLKHLPPDYRAVLVLRHFQQLAYEEMCQVLGLTMSQVKTRLHRARKMFKERYQRLAEVPDAL